MLRRPRARRRQAAIEIALPAAELQRLHAVGCAINAVAHDFNASNRFNPRALDVLLRRLRQLLDRTVSEPLQTGQLQTGQRMPAYQLAPATRYQVRKICTNLVQIADRFRANHHAPPLGVSQLIAKLRAILNNESASDGS
jgi:hypothetical protein